MNTQNKKETLYTNYSTDTKKALGTTIQLTIKKYFVSVFSIEETLYYFVNIY